MNRKTVGIFCGGSSYEHEVSIITGIQVVTHIDREQFDPVFVYFDKENNPFLLENFKDKKDFKAKKHEPIDLVKTKQGLVLQRRSTFSSRIDLDVVYLAFHGGMGESGQVQGFLEYCQTPHTSASSEGSTISMNKALTKEVLVTNKITTLPWVRISQTDTINEKVKEAEEKLSFPMIVKPVHLGSSIAIKIVHTAIALEQQLKLALQLDNEVLVEPALSDFTEYNISIRSTGATIECSPIEEPIKTSETLSFSDKYDNGGKKTGGAGMESLERVLPAKIDSGLKGAITNAAQATYRACRLSGLVRIDFMYADGKLYCSEINPIPGSMSFYLWEAAGEQFAEQITQSIQDAIERQKAAITIVPYETDIVSKFIAN